MDKNRTSVGMLQAEYEDKGPNIRQIMEVPQDKGEVNKIQELVKNGEYFGNMQNQKKKALCQRYEEHKLTHIGKCRGPRDKSDTQNKNQKNGKI